MNGMPQIFSYFSGKKMLESPPMLEKKTTDKQKAQF